MIENSYLAFERGLENLACECNGNVLTQLKIVRDLQTDTIENSYLASPFMGGLGGPAYKCNGGVLAPFKRCVNICNTVLY